MEDKIRFFEEALAADPRSTLFHRLAKLHVEQDDAEKAIAVLRQGLEVHPDHLRANCMLAGLLRKTGETEQALIELERVTSVLEESPELLEGWAEKLSRSGKSDAALAASFLASSFRGDDVSWTGLIEQGLRQLIPGQAQKKSLDQDLREKRQEGSQPSAEPVLESPLEPALGDGEDEAGEIHPDDIEATLLEEQPARDRVQEQGSPPEGAEAAVPSAVADERETEDSLDPVQGETRIRTRTMADILVEQGDYAQAMEIYQELLESSPEDSEQRKEIEASVNALREKLADSKEKKLLRTLERLAERLENRASPEA